MPDGVVKTFHPLRCAPEGSTLGGKIYKITTYPSAPELYKLYAPRIWSFSESTLTYLAISEITFLRAYHACGMIISILDPCPF